MLRKSRSLLILLILLGISQALIAGTLKAAVQPPKQMKILAVENGQPMTQTAILRLTELGKLSDLNQVLVPTQSQAMIDFHLALANQDFSKSILVRKGLKVSREWTEQLYLHSKGLFIHLTIQRHQYSIFFLGFSESEVLESLKAFQKLYSGLDGSGPLQTKFLAMGQLLNKALANEVANPKSQTSSSSKGGTLSALERFAYGFTESSINCIVSAAQGFNSATVEPFITAARAGKLAVTDPSRFWDNSVREWETIKSTVLNFDSVARKQVEGFVGMPPEQKSRALCQFLGGGSAGGVSVKVAKAAINPGPVTALIKAETQISATSGVDGSESLLTVQKQAKKKKQKKQDSEELMTTDLDKFLDEASSKAMTEIAEQGRKESILFRKMYMTDADIEKMKAIGLDAKIPVDKLPAELFKVYKEARLRDLTPEQRKRVEAALENTVQGPTKANAQASYSALTNQIELNIEKEALESISHYHLVAHEMEHAIQLVNTSAKKEIFKEIVHRAFLPSAKYKAHYRQELGATKAEYDFLRTVPSAAFKKMINDLESRGQTTLAGTLNIRYIVAKAGTFEKYKSTSGYHSYEAVKDHYRVSLESRAISQMLILGATTPGVYGAQKLCETFLEEKKEKCNVLP